MKIFIATPTAGGTVTTAYTQSVVAATMAIHERGGAYQYSCVDGADVVVARNFLAHRFLSDPTLTHILFIDSDMSITLQVFRFFLDQNLPLLGAAYSERRMDMAAFAKALTQDPDEARARAIASKFTVRIPAGDVTVTNNMAKVTSVGFGCVLIKREVFAALIDKQIVKPFVSRLAAKAGFTGTVYDFFDEIALPNGDWLSEDYAFCRRVSELGDVDVNAYVGDGVGHVGQFVYGGPYIERLKSGIL